MKVRTDKREEAGEFPAWVGFGMAAVAMLGARPFVNGLMNHSLGWEQAVSLVCLSALLAVVFSAYNAIAKLRTNYLDAFQLYVEKEDKSRDQGRRLDELSQELYRLRFELEQLRGN